jgi:GTP-binding protein
LSTVKVESAEFIKSAHRDEDFSRDGRPEVAFAGRSNVGKSSLMNRLLGRKSLARTSSTPGRTRAVNYFLVNGRFYFVDLPGYGYAKAGRDERREWAGLVDRYLRVALPKTRVVLLVDAKVGATPLDVQAFQYLTSLGAPVTVVATKVDKLPSSKRHLGLSSIRRALAGEGGEAGPGGSEPEVIPASARTGEGLKQVWGAIASHLEVAR